MAPSRPTVQPGTGGGGGGHGGHHHSLAQQLGRLAFVGPADVEEKAVTRLGQGWEEPRRQAVGVDGQRYDNGARRLVGVQVAGAAFLFGYAALAARRAIGVPASTVPGSAGAESSPSRTTVLATCLAFTWLNPAVYLDTVVLIGSVANSSPGRQWRFAAGAALGSVAWFAGLGFGARMLTPLLARRRAWRWLDAFTAFAMTAIGMRVLLGG